MFIEKIEQVLSLCENRKPRARFHIGFNPYQNARIRLLPTDPIRRRDILHDVEDSWLMRTFYAISEVNYVFSTRNLNFDFDREDVLSKMWHYYKCNILRGYCHFSGFKTPEKTNTYGELKSALNKITFYKIDYESGAITYSPTLEEILSLEDFIYKRMESGENFLESRQLVLALCNGLVNKYK